MAPSSGRPLALITGASSGIGEAYARALAARQHDLWLVARRGDRLEAIADDLATEFRIVAQPLRTDLARPEELEALCARIAGTPPDFVVNSAGVGSVGLLWEQPWSREDALIATNVRALLRVTHCVLGPMVARGSGTLVQVSSLSGELPSPRSASFGASKAFVTSLSESLAEELRGTGVRIQALCPGFTRTDFQDEAGIDRRRIPDAVWMEPEEVVRASLDALRSGRLICIPGVRNRAARRVWSAVPRRWLRRVSEFATRGADA